MASGPISCRGVILIKKEKYLLGTLLPQLGIQGMLLGSHIEEGGLSPAEAMLLHHAALCGTVWPPSLQPGPKFRWLESALKACLRLQRSPWAPALSLLVRLSALLKCAPWGSLRDAHPWHYHLWLREPGGSASPPLLHAARGKPENQGGLWCAQGYRDRTALTAQTRESE